MDKVPGRRVDWNAPGHSHELTLSTYKKEAILSCDPVRRILLEALDEVRKRLDFQVWAYVIMPDHVHILLYPNRRTYSIEGIRAALRRESGYRVAAWLTAHHPGLLPRLRVMQGQTFKHHIWQEGKGYDRNLWTPPLIWKCIRYIHGNPVKAGLCETPSDWPWSSFRFYEGLWPVEFAVDPCQVDPPAPGDGIWQVWWEPE